jgi:ribonuclease VapC
LIVVDTSALMAVILEEANHEPLSTALAGSEAVAMSAGTYAETLIVSRRRGVGLIMSELIQNLNVEIHAVTPPFGLQVADAYDRWGKGVHPAGLNFGDCFAYALAKHLDWPLLFVGGDFAQTDIRNAI